MASVPATQQRQDHPEIITLDQLQNIAGLDSITLGQLKSVVNAQPKPKQTMYDYRYDDEDTVFNEIEEFYSYVEVPQVAENMKAWLGSFSGEWSKSSVGQRKAHIEFLLESLEHRDAEIRFTNARRLLYVLQGTFAETTSPEHQLHWIIENCKLVRDAGGVNIIVGALKIASSKHDLLSSLSDADAYQYNITPAEKQEFVEEVNTELSVYLGMLYFLVEMFKGDEQFGEELMSLNPPLPVYMYNLVSSLKDKSAKGYPVKKLLLVLWKSLLACLGGVRDLARVKKLNRKLLGLGDPAPNSVPLKSSPLDFQTFRQETAVKYPTFTPDPANDLPSFKLAEAYAPIPIRPHYNHHQQVEDIQGPPGMPNSGYGQQRPQQLPPTPAPSPPPNMGKTKKTQYQTDQSRPFVFPFSSRVRPQKLVPFAIDEADRLYAKHMYISASLYQMWRTREECILDESGLQNLPTHRSGSDFAVESARISEVLALAKGDRRFSMTSTSYQDPEGPSLPDIEALDEALEKAEARMKRADAEGDRAELRRAKEEMDDLVRLRRVEQIYSMVLPILPGWVLVLLKLLLATVSATNNQIPQSATNASFPGGVGGAQGPEQPPQPPPSLEDIDVMRHREITSKAVSAILLLTLKWFKASHVMKFHHLGQLLLDSNCLLIVLKMFGLQEVATLVATRNDQPDLNFFRYCFLNFSSAAHSFRPEDSILSPPRQATAARMASPGTGQPGNEEIELISTYSWRNFFSSINFLRIVQKLSKHRSHRILLLVQYKSSAILKRILRVQHPLLQLYTLKLIKMQVPFCGRKWRQSNMKVITSIYLHCRPELRDEWLSGTEVEDVGDAHEQALRMLIKFYNTKRYGSNNHNQSFSGFMHRRTSSLSVPNVEGLQSGEVPGVMRPSSTPNMVDADVFPPLRSKAPDPNIFLPYIPEDIAFEEEYEEYLSDLGSSESPDNPFRPSQPSSAWQRLATLGPEIADGISDSESITSIGDLGDDVRGDLQSEKDSLDENLNSWEHMSPKTMATLPKSPAGHGRRSSSGTGLRPVLHFDLDEGSAIQDDDEDDGLEMGPIPKEKPEPFAAGEGGKGVDEVEYLYGE